MIKGGITESKRKSNGRIEDDSESKVGTRWYMHREELGVLF